MPPNSEVTLATKIAYLRRGDSYPHGPDDVEVIETHFAFLFLAGPFVYKLKKPIRFHEIDFTTPELRRANCESELVLNRRLAESAYIGVVPLAFAAGGLSLESGQAGFPVDWLVKMHRLPREQTLEARAAAGPIARDELRPLVAKLVRFYSETTRAAWNGHEYLRHLEREILARGNELLAYLPSLQPCPVGRIVGDQLRFLGDAEPATAARCTAGRVVDAHGDLRPEHIFLTSDPQIIDCLEFSPQMRLLDAAEEIAFLALECAQFGKPEIGRDILDLYREIANDPVPQALIDFYVSRRACVRALLCVWHLDEPLSESMREHWRNRAQRYLDIAGIAISRRLGSGIFDRSDLPHRDLD